MDALVTHSQYRPCVGIALFNAQGKVFVGQRRSERVPDPEVVPYEWQMPQGGIDPGEDPFEAALRELFEETNIRSVERLAEAPNWYSYDLPSFDATGRVFRGRYRGQIQKWFALRFIGQEHEIDVLAPGEGQFRPEFSDWRWENLEALPGLIVPFKRGVYEQVVRDFTPYAG